MFLLIFNQNSGISLQKLEPRKYSIGRSPSSDIFLSGGGISRHHATIYVSKDDFWIADGTLEGQASTNGLFVNGHRVIRHKLRQYDAVTFHKGIHALFLDSQAALSAPELAQALIRNVVYFTYKNTLKWRVKKQHDHVHKTIISPQPEAAEPLLDALTNLPNRTAFLARIQKTLEFKQRVSVDHKFAILFIDVDKFKMINDTLGHLVGDQFLILIAEKLNDCLREGDMVARFGGDEFAILLDNLKSSNEAIAITERLQHSLSRPFTIEKHELYPSVSIGIASSSLGYQTTEDMLRDADMAMYQAKSTGRSKFVIFDETMDQKAKQLLRLDKDLQQSLENHELALYYQPIISLQTKKLVGFEALVRWHHPELGTISPDVFVPIAEETSLIYQIGQWTLDEACRQLSLWKANPLIKVPLTMNINISSKQLFDTRLVERIKDTMARHQVRPSELKLEVTEGIIMESITYASRIFNQLHQLGVKLAIDDFGTGYSSLSHLNQFPIDMLKVDKSFVSQIDNLDDNISANVTNSIISLAHSIDVQVVAEGIERLYHLAWLQQQKCDFGQGFLLSQPLCAEAATALAETGLEWTWKC